MSETYGNTGPQNDDSTREPGAVAPTFGTDSYGTDTHGTDTNSPGTGQAASAGGGMTGSPTGDTKEVAKEEARATGEQAKEGARHVAEVGKEEVKNVAQETSQQAKELWHQTRSQLLDQTAQQQTRVAEGLRSLSQELSSMASGSEHQGVASDLAQQASTRMGDVAGWLDQRDPGSLVSEVKQFARHRPGAFLAAAAVIGLVGGRLSRGLVADHQDQADANSQSEPSSSVATPADRGTGGSPAYSTESGTTTLADSHAPSGTFSGAAGVQGGTASGSGLGTAAGGGELPR